MPIVYNNNNNNSDSTRSIESKVNLWIPLDAKNRSSRPENEKG